MGKKQLICLANSRKLSGRCIAGKEPDRLWWVRPVTDSDTGEIRLGEIKLDPKPLDIIEYPYLRYKTTNYHPENLVIGTSSWTKIGEYPFENLNKLCDSPEELWTNEEPDSHKISLEYLKEHKIPNSLFLIKPEAFEIFFGGEYRADGNPKLTAIFKYKNQGYILPVTDIAFEKQFKDIKSHETYKFNCDDIYLCISLGEPHNGFCYKLVAAIIQKQGKPDIEILEQEEVTPTPDKEESSISGYYITIDEPISLNPNTLWALWFLAKDSLESDEINQFSDIYEILCNVKSDDQKEELEKVKDSLMKRYKQYQSGIEKRSEITTKDAITLEIFKTLKSVKIKISRVLLKDILKGSKSKRIKQYGLTTADCYGLMSNYSRQEVYLFIDGLVWKGYLEMKEEMSDYGVWPFIHLTNKALNALSKGKLTE